MSQQDSKSASISPNGCGCLLLLMGIGVIGAIALPSFLNTSNRPRFPEAKQYVDSMNKGQQAYFEEESAFATSVNVLGLGIKTETTNFKYSVRATKETAFNYGVSKQKDFKSYVGGVFVIRMKSKNGEEQMRTQRILCRADTPGTIPPLPPRLQNSELVCATGTTEVTK
ncbi:type IV pilin-like G/H family protein [Microcoleus sp. Pol11C1]|uniref:type IV pilin-like G/H family protein n=1 Tax=unclassified Microcoleus TaxID=2642155 RepID=UPI002FD30F74